MAKGMNWGILSLLAVVGVRAGRRRLVLCLPGRRSERSGRRGAGRG